MWYCTNVIMTFLFDFAFIYVRSLKFITMQKKNDPADQLEGGTICTGKWKLRETQVNIYFMRWKRLLSIETIKRLKRLKRFKRFKILKRLKTLKTFNINRKMRCIFLKCFLFTRLRWQEQWAWASQVWWKFHRKREEKGCKKC